MTDDPRVETAEPLPAGAPEALAGPVSPAPRGVPPPWLRLGRLLHTLGHLRIPFFALAVFFQFKTMFFSTGKPFLDNLNITLLMYGIAMSFEGLRDNGAISEKARREWLAHQKAWRWMIAAVFLGGLFSMAVGCSQFFLTDNRELGWGITTFGLGMIALGRQRYDQYTSVLSAAAAPDPPETVAR